MDEIPCEREILSIWPSKDTVLPFTEIHNEFVRHGIVSDFKYKSSTTRILKRLVEENYLEKVNGGYKLKIDPQPFTIVDKLKELQLKYGTNSTYEWSVDIEPLTTLAEGVILGMPTSIDKNSNFKEILDVLLTRLANIFEAVRLLALTIRIAEKSCEDLSSVPPPEDAVREFLLNLVPHILGEISGIDGDGLPTEDLLNVLEQICHNLPDNVNFQPITKELLHKKIHIARNFYSELTKLDLILDNPQVEEIRKECKNIALIVHPPRKIFDEEGEDERRLYEYLKHCIENNMSNALMLVNMRYHKEKIVDKVLKFLKLQSLLSVKRANELWELYCLTRAGVKMNSAVSRYCSLKKKGKLTFKDMKDIREQLELTQQEYGLEKMIIGVWLSNLSKDRYPKFIYSCKIEGDIIEFASKVISEFFETLNIESPKNLEKLVKEGYKLREELNKMLKEDANKFQHIRNKRKM